MTVKEVILLAADNLRRDDLREAITSGEYEAASGLLRCYNLVENEIALDFFPLKYEEEVEASNGRVSYSALSHAPVNVHRVRVNGKDAAFELSREYLSFAGEGRKAEVLYSYSPESKDWEDESSFSGRISARLMAYGVDSEFCLSNGLYSEAAMWEKKYRDALTAVNIIRRKLSMRSRRWA